jgi:hypothetical protein
MPGSLMSRIKAGSAVPSLIEVPCRLAKADFDDPLDHWRILNNEDPLVRVFWSGCFRHTQSIGTPR